MSAMLLFVIVFYWAFRLRKAFFKIVHLFKTKYRELFDFR